MRLSTRTRYGARAMVVLAEAYPERAVSVKEMAEHQRISQKYLEQIMGVLKSAGLVQSVRGVHGGYSLMHPPDTMTMLEVYEALEGPAKPVDCATCNTFDRTGERCPTQGLWLELGEVIAGTLSKWTLQELMERHRQAGQALHYEI